MKILTTAALLTGLIFGPALAQSAGTAGAPEEVTIEALQELAETMNEKIYVLTGAELDAFAAAIEPQAGPKPAEIATIVVPDPEGKDGTAVVTVAFFDKDGKFLYFGQFTVGMIQLGLGQNV